MSEKFQIIEELYAGHYQGYAYTISNEKESYTILEEKEIAQRLCDLLNTYEKRGF